MRSRRDLASMTWPTCCWTLLQAAAEVGRRAPGEFAKCGRKGAAAAEAELQADLGHGYREVRQQALGVVDPAADVIAMRWHPERMPECAGEVIGAQPRQTRQGCERHILGKVLVDVVGYAFLLPGGQSSTREAVRRRGAAVDAQQLMQHDEAERLQIKPRTALRPLDLRLELHGGVPQIAVEEEHAWRKLRLREPELGGEQRTARIDVKV